MKIDFFKIITRVSIGSVFIIAAILKLLSIDNFEIYIYSFNIFNFLLTTFFSRLLIAGELIIGLALIFKLYYKTTWRVTLSIQIIFTLFLLFVAIFRNDSNCHCFGDIVELSPIESIVKNIIIILLLFFVKTTRPQDNKTTSKIIDSTCFKVVIISAAIIIPFVVTPMDSVYKMIYSSDKEISSIDLYKSFDNVVEMDFVDNDIVFDSTAVIDMEGRQMIVIVSSGCKYCRLGVKKLSMMMSKNGISHDNVKIFIWGSREGILNFREETLTEDYSYWHIMPHEAIDITLGRFPTFIILEEKKLVNVGDFRDINESYLDFK